MRTRTRTRTRTHAHTHTRTHAHTHIHTHVRARARAHAHARTTFSRGNYMRLKPIFEAQRLSELMLSLGLNAKTAAKKPVQAPVVEFNFITSFRERLMRKVCRREDY